MKISLTMSLYDWWRKVELLRDVAKTVRHHGYEEGCNKIQNDYGDKQAKVLNQLADQIESKLPSLIREG